MKFKYLCLSAAALLLPSEAMAGKNNQTEHIEVPGGMNEAKLTRLWASAKEVCFANEYEEINEQREISTLICRQDNMSIYLKFDASGFTIRVQSLFAKTPVFGHIFSSPRKHRQRMIDALLAAAGQSPARRP